MSKWLTQSFGTFQTFDSKNYGTLQNFGTLKQIVIPIIQTNILEYLNIRKP
jgi:hypothetical protein